MTHAGSAETARRTASANVSRGPPRTSTAATSAAAAAAGTAARRASTRRSSEGSVRSSTGMERVSGRAASAASGISPACGCGSPHPPGGWPPPRGVTIGSRPVRIGGSRLSGYTKRNLREDVEDSAVKFGMGEVLEAHFARDDLEATQFGISLQMLKPNQRVPFGHFHERQEEVYVVVGGSGR